MKQPLANLLIIMLCVLVLASCKGGLCAATMSGLDDADSDCIEDSGDNCRVMYNPDQFDGDSDGVGYYCDSDDADEYVAMTLIYDPKEVLADNNYGAATDDPAYLKPDLALNAEKDFDISAEDGVYFLVSCDGNFLGMVTADILNNISIANTDGEFGDENSEYSILNDQGYYGRSSTACSAFNTRAVAPPTMFYRDLVQITDSFVGYFTLNSDLAFAIDACDALAALGVSAASCE